MGETGLCRIGIENPEGKMQVLLEIGFKRKYVAGYILLAKDAVQRLVLFDSITGFSGSTKCLEFLEQLNDCNLVKKDCAER
jgi:hypothetical protein